MILRKGAALSGGQPAASIGTVPPPRAAQGNRSRVVAIILVLIGVQFAILLIRANRISTALVEKAAVVRLRTLAPSQTTQAASLDNCGLIKQLLDGTISSTTEGLPSSGKATSFGAVFWLKSPVLRAKLPESGDEIVLLKYNKYLPKQHTLKWTNTVSILNEYRDGRVFPKMHGYCRDPGDGFHYIVVEWIDLHPSEMIRPKSFEQCFHRATKLVKLLEILDEEMHLAFMDVKKGQWMSRPDELSFVLQDVDDIVRAPWTPSNEPGDFYRDQMDTALRIIQGFLPQKTAIGYVKKIWEEKMFPKGYTIRYAMTLLQEMIINDMGFNWSSDCKFGMPDGFRPCLDEVIKWAATIQDDWPAPRQVLWAMNECKRQGSFDRSSDEAKRPPAPWRDASPFSGNHASARYISCIRASDSVKKTDPAYTENIHFCSLGEDGIAFRISNSTRNGTISCCRPGHGIDCYYAVADKICENLQGRSAMLPLTTASITK